MIDPGTLGSFPLVIGTIDKVVSIAKKLKEGEAKPEEIIAELANLKNQIADLKLERADLIEHIVALREENRKLTEAAAEKDLLIYEHGAYFKKEGEKYLVGPFCPRCYEDRGKLISCAWNIGEYTSKVYWNCIQAKSKNDPCFWGTEEIPLDISDQVVEIDLKERVKQAQAEREGVETDIFSDSHNF